MKEGYIAYEKDIRWTPKGEWVGPIIHILRKYEVMLRKRKFFKRTKMNVFRCPDCQVDIIDEKQLD